MKSIDLNKNLKIINKKKKKKIKKLRSLTIGRQHNIGRRTSNVKVAILVDKNGQFFGNGLQFDHTM
ncbi:hypothetical protein T01_7237 [Trichinella spiralis]|uniref:Uncharacterized protein n=1 Tax=Trichinella spiralis TaxID=6334 RepID=A0A0V1B7U2_TRISP|nr:hypothetical protein T01_7237 [Trichinella spiralis]